MRRPYIFRLEENKAVVRKAVEALNNQDLTSLDMLIASDYIDHTRQVQGIEALKQFYTKIFEDFPDFHRTIQDIIAEGEKVCLRSTMTGTDPTGKKMELTLMNIFHLAKGKVVEVWGGVVQEMVIPKVPGEVSTKLR